MQQFLAQDLMQAHSPMIGDRNKRTVFEMRVPRRPSARAFSNTGCGVPYPCPEASGLTCKRPLIRVSQRRGFFDYVRSGLLPNAVEWHVNFADPILFGAYGTACFAQDEIQVAEHLALAALHEALAACQLPVLIVEDGSSC
jgi:hypothetical protein